MAIKAVNNTAGPNSLIPTLLVFGALPRIAYADLLLPLITQRAAAIKIAMTEIAKIYAKR